MEEITCDMCGGRFAPTDKMVRGGYSPRKGEWTFLAICSRCGSVQSPTVPASGDYGCPFQ